MKSLIAVIVALGNIALVHAEPLESTRDDPKFSVEIRFMSRTAALKTCKELGAWKGSDQPRPTMQVGCNLFYLDRKHCVVIVQEPNEVDDTATTVLGHEVLHCAKGHYHK